jgi:hypothetical protein
VKGLRVNLSTEYPCVMNINGEDVEIFLCHRKDPTMVTVSIVTTEKIKILFPNTIKKLKESSDES